MRRRDFITLSAELPLASVGGTRAASGGAGRRIISVLPDQR
jgi:hypothetical protein